MTQPTKREQLAAMRLEDFKAHLRTDEQIMQIVILAAATSTFARLGDTQKEFEQANPDFKYTRKTPGDDHTLPRFGLVAEEVDKVNPALITRDGDGKPYTVRYEAVNAMLLNEFLKEHRKTEKLEATVANLMATVKEQTAEIQRVSAQLELNKRAPQTVMNNQ